MTLLSMAKVLSQNVGMEDPVRVVTSDRREHKEIVVMANAVGEELARRGDWGVLQNSVLRNGNGSNNSFTMGTDFARIGEGIAVTTSEGFARPLSRAEWGGLPDAVGVPRYFLLEGDRLRFWPVPAQGEAVTINTQSGAWCSNGTSAFTSDTDSSLIDEDLFTKGLIVCWRRQKGMDYADFEAEFEAALRDFAGFDDRARI